MSFTVVGAGSRVLGVGLADDVLVYLVPLVLIVTSGQRRGGGWVGGEREGHSWVRLLRMHPLAGPDGGISTASAHTHGDYTDSMCPRDRFLLEEEKKGSSRGRRYQAAH